VLFVVVLLLLEEVLVGAEGGEAVEGAALVGVTMRFLDTLVLEMTESLGV
jgi:hypothetical protein